MRSPAPACTRVSSTRARTTRPASPTSAAWPGLSAAAAASRSPPAWRRPPRCSSCWTAATTWSPWTISTAAATGCSKACAAAAGLDFNRRPVHTAPRPRSRETRMVDRDADQPDSHDRGRQASRHRPQARLCRVDPPSPRRSASSLEHCADLGCTLPQVPHRPLNGRRQGGGWRQRRTRRKAATAICGRFAGSFRQLLALRA